MPVLPDVEDVPKAVPCVACPRPSECAIWGKRVCYVCATDWRDHAPDYEAIEAKYGANADTAAVYRAFTERWISARKGRAA